MEPVIRYGIAAFGDGEILTDTLEWTEGTFPAAVEAVKAKGRNFCGLFYYPDISEAIRQTVFKSTADATASASTANPSAGTGFSSKPTKRGKM